MYAIYHSLRASVIYIHIYSYIYTYIQAIYHSNRAAVELLRQNYDKVVYIHAYMYIYIYTYIQAIYHSNRAAVELLRKNYGKVVTDCQTAIKLNPQHIKAYFRCAKAQVCLSGWVGG